MDLRTRIKQLVEPGAEHDLAAAERARALTKWFFDFVRNVMILGVIKYAADKSGSWLMHGLYVAGSVVLFLYIYSYYQVWYLRPFQGLSKWRVAPILDFVFNVGAGIVWFVLAQWALNTATDAIAKMQG